jgi:hypothetical protein
VTAAAPLKKKIVRIWKIFRDRVLLSHEHGAQWSSAEQMHVQMKYFLAAIAIAVD